MSYALKLEQTHITAYSANVTMVAQQMRNALMGSVTEIAARGEAMSAADIYGDLNYLREEPRSRRNPENVAEATRRWLVMPERIESGQYIDKEDVLKGMMDPTANIVRVHTAAVTRGWQDRILGVSSPTKTDGDVTITEGGILGIAREGKTPGAGTPLPAGQYIAHASTALTLDKLREAVRRLRKANFGMDEMSPLYGAITADQIDDLIAIAQETKASLNSFDVEEMRTGKPRQLLGINWIWTNRLPLKSAGVRIVPIWARNNIVAGVWEGLQGDAWLDTHAKKLPYAYVWARLDCVRLQDKGVIAIECSE